MSAKALHHHGAFGYLHGFFVTNNGGPGSDKTTCIVIWKTHGLPNSGLNLGSGPVCRRIWAMQSSIHDDCTLRIRARSNRSRSVRALDSCVHGGSRLLGAGRGEPGKMGRFIHAKQPLRMLSPKRLGGWLDAVLVEAFCFLSEEEGGRRTRRRRSCPLISQSLHVWNIYLH